jgi:hypothetical protein
MTGILLTDLLLSLLVLILGLVALLVSGYEPFAVGEGAEVQ